MNNFRYVDRSIEVLFITLTLILVSGCVAVQKPGVGQDTGLRPAYSTAAGGQRIQPRCPVRQMYVCERRFRTRPGTCYCTPESAILQPGIHGGRLF